MKCSTRCGQTVELFHDIFQRFSRQIPPQIVQCHLIGLGDRFVPDRQFRSRRAFGFLISVHMYLKVAAGI